MTVIYTYIETEKKNMYLFALQNDDGSYSYPTLRFNFNDVDFQEIDDSKLIYQIFDNLRHGCLDSQEILMIKEILLKLENKSEQDLFDLQSILFTGFKHNLIKYKE